MNGSLIIALYAAIVATTGVIWQVFLWRAEHAGRLSVTAGAHWSLDEEAVQVTIINRNSYDVPLDNVVSLGTKGERGSLSGPIYLDRLGLARVIPARSKVEWEIDRPLLVKEGRSLAGVSDVDVRVYTAAGRREIFSTKVADLDESTRTTWAEIGEFGEINYLDIVRIRATPSNVIDEYAGRIGEVRGFHRGENPTFQVMFDDGSSIHVPIADVGVHSGVGCHLRF